MTVGLDALSDQHKQEAMSLACDLVRTFATDVQWSLAEDGLPEVEEQRQTSGQENEMEEENENDGDAPPLTQVHTQQDPCEW